MSISFIVDVQIPRKSIDEPCLCAQMSPVFGALMRRESDDWQALRADADPGCVACGGTGVERVERDERPQANFANANAELIAAAMALDLDGGIGACELAVFRRGLLRARNVSQPDELRAAEEGPRYYAPGYSADDLSRALGRLEGLVEQAIALGATRILWQ